MNTPVSSAGARLRNCWGIWRDKADEYPCGGKPLQCEPSVDVYGSMDGRDLGGVAEDTIGSQFIQGTPSSGHSNFLERTGDDHAVFVHRTAGRAGHVDCAGLPANRGELPVVA